jgi:TPR repeat protein
MQGDNVAQLNLGAMTSRGDGVPQNYLNGLILIGLSARGGNLLAKENLKIAGVKESDLKFTALLDACQKITLVKCFEFNDQSLFGV